jgi:hypothetical protein
VLTLRLLGYPVEARDSSVSHAFTLEAMRLRYQAYIQCKTVGEGQGRRLADSLCLEICPWFVNSANNLFHM